MNRSKSLLSSIVLIAGITINLSTVAYSQNIDLTKLKGPYLGQEPPGKTPQVFAPGLVSTNDPEFSITISKNENEIYFSRNDLANRSRIYAFILESNGWVSKNPPLFGWDGEEFEPNFSPDGKRLYFNSNRQATNMEVEGREWYVEKTSEKWSVPKLIGSKVLGVGNMFMTQSNDGTIYFTGFSPKRGIYSAKINGDDFGWPVFLPGNINNFRNASHPYIAPDESYIIFDYNINDTNGDRNLMISFRKGDTWLDPINIENYFGLEKYSYIPFVTFDQKYFFFSSGGNIYWMDAGFIEELRPKN